MTEALAYLGLGTNLGDRRNNLQQALGLLAGEPRLRLSRCSQIYETEPWGVADQPAFLNCVAEVATSLDPESLLGLCKRVEEELGRQPGLRWGPRLIDLDILLYGNEVVGLPHLEIPHPRLHVRAFALIPLAELAPEAVHPLLELSVAELLEKTGGIGGVRPWEGENSAVGPADC